MKFKKLAAVALCVCMLVCILPLFSYSRAYDGVAFLVINNVLTRPLKSQTMPVFIGSEVYIPYSALDALSMVSYSFDPQKELLCVYNAGGYLTFDLASKRTYDEKGTLYPVSARYINDTVYIPVDTTCDKFGFYHSVSILSMLAPMVRIHEGELVGTDLDYTSRLYSLFSSTYNEFIDANDLPVDYTEYTPDKQTAYIIFYGAGTSDADRLMNALGSVKGCFMLTRDEIYSCGDFIRQAAANGHTIGFALDPKSDISLTQQYLDASFALELECGLVSRIATVTGGSDCLSDEQKAELDTLSLRIWDNTADADSLDDEELKSCIFSDSADVFAFVTNEQTHLRISLLTERDELSFAPVYEWTFPVNRAQIY